MNLPEKHAAFWLAAVAIALLLLIAVFCRGMQIGRWDSHRKAINCGAGYYAVDPETGETWFVWGRKAAEGRCNP